MFHMMREEKEIQSIAELDSVNMFANMCVMQTQRAKQLEQDTYMQKHTTNMK